MLEPTISCPKCKEEIKLTESLAAPLLESLRLDYDKRLAKKDAEMARREGAMREREAALEKAKSDLEEQVAQKLGQERVKIAAEEAKKAQRALASDLADRAREIAELNEVLKKRDEKLAEAQTAQAELLRKQRELDDAKRELELTVEKRVQEGLDATREQARKEAEESLRLKVSEKEQTIASMQKQIEELKRKAEQGSQQLQGEVQELELETLLAEKFPGDTIAPVPKGEFGGDVLQTVIGPLGQVCGSILWETKRTKNWSDQWLPKLRGDQRAAKAEIAVIVSQTLPKDIDSFHLLDHVWVTSPKCAIPVAICLREWLLELARARQTRHGQETKAEMVYSYVTSPQFRQRVQAIVEAFSTMKEDLAKEKRAIQRQWAKREQQLERVLETTAGMYGDLQGIAGKSLKEIEGMELELPEDREPDALPSAVGA